MSYQPVVIHPEPSQNSSVLMRRASLLSLVIGVSLIVLKGIAWSLTDSLSILSSLIDSAMDVIASGINFIAIRYALQPPDAEHRFGHGKAEDLATLAQSMFICGSGLFLVVEGIKRLVSPETVHLNPMALGIMILSCLMALGLTIYQRRVVAKTNSSAIAADAMHYMADFLTNSSVVVALLLTSMGITHADPIIALLIAGYIIYGSFTLSQHAFQGLMDREFSDEERDTVIKTVMRHQDSKGIHDLRTRKSGIYRFIQFHLDLDSEMSLKRAHEISDQIEKDLLTVFPNTEILIHQDPLGGDTIK